MGNENIRKYLSSCCDQNNLKNNESFYKDHSNDSINRSLVIKAPKGKYIYKDELQENKENHTIQNENDSNYDEFNDYFQKVLKIQRNYRIYKNKKKKLINLEIQNKNVTLTKASESNKPNISSINENDILIPENEIEQENNTNLKEINEITEKSSAQVNALNGTKLNNANIQMLPSKVSSNQSNDLSQKISSRDLSVQDLKNFSSKMFISNNISIITRTTHFSQVSGNSSGKASPRISNRPKNFNNAFTQQLIYLNPKEIHGYFLRKSKKSLKYKGNIDIQSKKKNGYGYVTWEDGSIFEANFINNHAEGFCRFIHFPSKDIFSGFYNANVPEGYGIYTQTENYISYEGYWNKNSLTGIGIEICKDVSFYQGEFQNCLKHGVGIYRWSNGSIYQGEFNNNEIDGYGTLMLNDDKIYYGQFKHGKLEGIGYFTWKNGCIYSGYYKNDLKNGFGVFLWRTKPILAYFGFWSEGKQHGVGVKIKGKNDSIFGLWKEGKIQCYLSGFWESEKYFKPDQIKYKYYFKKDPMHVLKLFHIFDRDK